MGQYYIAANLTDKSFYDFMCPKLIEHAWLNTQEIITVHRLLARAKEPQQIIWVGDHAYPVLEINDFYGYVCDHYKSKRWSQAKDFDLASYVLVNHTSNEYLDYESYITELGYTAFCPLPLLVRVESKNSLGDYDGTDEEYIGRWVFDLVKLHKKKDFDLTGFTEIKPRFVYGR